MTREAGRPDTISAVEFMLTAEAVARSGKRQVVRVEGKPLSIAPLQQVDADERLNRQPQKPRARRKTGILKPDDALFRLIGIGEGKTPGGVSGKKHEALARAYRQK